MAYQPKSYRKFVATAATATLVATAVTPAFAAETGAANFGDVSDRYKEAVEYLVNNDIAQGITADQFGVALEIKRVDAAVMLAKALKLNTESAPASGFKDVPTRAVGAVNALKAAGIVNGKDADTFGSTDSLTRGEMALIIAKAYNLTGSAAHGFTDVAPRYEAAVKAMVANKITEGKTPTSFGTADSIKRGEFAIFLHRLAKMEQAVPAVTAVTATGARTLEFTGTNLQNLKAENLTVSGNSVASISANGDGTKAFATLTGNLVPNQETTVKTTIKEEVKEYKFTFSYVVNSVNVQNGTFDDDTPEQRVSLLVNSEAADYNYLALNGYTVQFKAFDEDGNAVNIFSNGSSTSATGELLPDFSTLLAGSASDKYYVEATVSKNGSISVSERATITVTNLDSAASSIGNVSVANAKGFEQQSGTLVVGEKAAVDEVTIATGSNNTKVTSGFKVTSSNPAVLSVAGNGVITAEAPGTATLTVTYGTLTKQLNMTVASKAREITKVTPVTSPATLLTEGTRTVKVKLTDQYGDPVTTNAGITVVSPVDYINDNNEVLAITDAAKGEANLQLTVKDKIGNGSVFFKNADNDILGSLAFTTSKVNNVSKSVLEVTTDSESKDLSIDLDNTQDDAVTLELVNYTSENVRNGVEPYANYRVETSSNNVTVTQVGNAFTVTASKAGSYDVAIYKNGAFVTKSTVVVTDNTPKATAVSWVNPNGVNYVGETLNYIDVLTVTESANDNIVKGITVSPSSVGEVRIEEQTGVAGNPQGSLYVDKNSNGEFDGDDVNLGTLQLKATTNSDFDNITAGTTANVITGVKTAAGDKGTLVFSLLNNKQEVIASTSVVVNVPGSTPTPANPAQEAAKQQFLTGTQTNTLFGTLDPQAQTITVNSGSLSQGLSGTGFFTSLDNLNVSKLAFTFNGQTVEVDRAGKTNAEVKDAILAEVGTRGLNSLDTITFTTTQSGTTVDVPLSVIVR